MGPRMHKHLKEEFVSNLNGTTMLEIAALAAVFPTFLLLGQLGSYYFMGQKGDGWSTFKALSLDYFSVVLPTLLSVTVLADTIYLLTAFLAFILIIALVVVRNPASAEYNVVRRPKQADRFYLGFISSYRFTIMLLTCVSILAVDFNIYPRRYAKAETYGTGLMDVGVGSFIIANAVVSREARDLPPMKEAGLLRKMAPLLLLGFARLIFTNGVDYQVHVGEYGMHWNFFFTLAAVTLLTSAIRVPPCFCGILGILILSVYEAILLSGVNNYLNLAERGSNIFSQNKEGLFSLFGYWGLYLLSVQLGYYLFKSGRSQRSLNVYGGRFSLPLSNLEGLGIMALSELAPGSKQLVIEELFAQNMLATFLLANVMTGLVNLTMDTLFVSTSVAFGTLSAYIAVLLVALSTLKYFNIRLKL